uniref:Uncharacterized protein n=1 Tax=Arundo donax TaxID=35708 RepID=A0A0A8XU00_ARUDO
MPNTKILMSDAQCLLWRGLGLPTK